MFKFETLLYTVLMLFLLFISGCKTVSNEKSGLKNNGYPVKDSESSYVVPVKSSMTVSNENNNSVCSGVVISNFPHVLTASHCLALRKPPSDVRVKIGGKWISAIKVDTLLPSASSSISSAQTIERYDLSIITLPQGSETVSPVKLVTMLPKKGDVVRVTGYGVRTMVSPFPNDPASLKDDIGGQRLNSGTNVIMDLQDGLILTKGPITVLGNKGEVTTARGDSGGALTNEETGELIGIVQGGDISYTEGVSGNDIVDTSKPSIDFYVDLSQTLDWIKKVTGQSH